MDTDNRKYSYIAWYNVTGSDTGFSFQSNGQGKEGRKQLTTTVTTTTLTAN